MVSIEKYVGYAIVDDDGFLIDTISFVEDEPHKVLDNYVNPLVPNFIRPRWDFETSKWIEGATQIEIDEHYKKPIRQPTEIEILREENEHLKERLESTEMAVLMVLDFI